LLVIVALYLRLATDDGQPEAERPTAELAFEASAIAGDLPEQESTSAEGETPSAEVVVDVARVTGVPAGAVAVIMGLVVDSEGQPIADAEVIARGGNSRFQLFQSTFDPEVVETTTDEEGRFVAPFTGSAVTIGVVAIDVRADGYAPTGIAIDQDRPWERPMGRREVTITLERGAPIIGRVETESGEALAGEIVYLGLIGNVNGTTRTLPHGSQETTTDADGRFRFDAVADGRITVGVMPDNMAPAHRMIEAPREEELVLIVEPSGVRLVGFVYHEDTEEPISGVTVTATHQDVRTYPPQMPEMWRMDSDSAGRFEFRNLPAGTHTLRPRKVGLHHNGARDKNARVELSLGQTSDIIELYLNDGITLFGTVVNSETSRPMEGVRVTIDLQGGGELDATTNAEGDFIVRGLPPMLSWISFESEDGTEWYPTGALDSAGGRAFVSPTESEIQAGRFVRQWGVENLVPMRGRVVRRSGGGVPEAALNGTVAEATYRNVHGLTDREGLFEVFAPSNSSLRLTVAVGGVALAISEQINSGEEGVDDIEIVVGATGSLRVRVVDPSGDAVENVMVNSQHGLEQQSHSRGGVSFLGGWLGRTGNDGWVEWKEFPSGVAIKLSASGEERGSSEGTELTLKENERREVTITLEAGRDILVRVIDQDDNPLRAAKIYILRGNTYNVAPASEREPGVYVVRGIPAKGSTGIMVVAERTSMSVAVGEDEEEVTVQLQVAPVEEREITVAVTVLDPDGDLVPDISARVLINFYGYSYRTRVDTSLDGTFYLETTQQASSRAIAAQVEVSAPGFATWAQMIRPAEEPDESGLLFMTITMQRAGVVRGRVVAEDNREAIEGVQVTWDGGSLPQGGAGPRESTRTDAEGRFELRRLGSGTNTLRINPPDQYSPRSLIVRSTSGESRDVGDVAIDRRAQRTVRLIGPAASIVNRTVGIGLSPTGTDQHATTNAQGVAAFSDAPTSITAASLQTDPPIMYQSLSAGLQRQSELEFPVGSGTLVLRLVNLPDHASVPQIALMQYHQDYAIQVFSFHGANAKPADSTGVEIHFADLPEGEWEVRGSLNYRIGPAHRSHRISGETFARTGAAHQEAVIDVGMGYITGRIVDSDGEPIRNASATLMQTQPRIPLLTVNSEQDGRFRLLVHQPGTQLSFSHPDHGAAVFLDEGEWDMEPGAEVDLGDVALGQSSGATLVVELYRRSWNDEDPTPAHTGGLIGGIVVRDADGTPLPQTSDVEMAVRYHAVEPGIYEIEFEGNDFMTPGDPVTVVVPEDSDEDVVAILILDPIIVMSFRALQLDGNETRDVEWTIDFPRNPETPSITATASRESSYTRITGIPHPVFRVTGRTSDGRSGSEEIDIGSGWRGGGIDVLVE